MSVVLQLAGRNIRVYLRNRMSVFFSFLSVLIIIGLYALFLGKVQVDGIRRQVGEIHGIGPLVSSWIVAGLLAINAVTVSLGALGAMVYDVEQKRFTDFVVAPVKRSAVVASYLVSALVIGLLFTLIALAAGEAYIVATGGQVLGLLAALRVVGILALAVVSSSSIMYLLVSFLRSGSAFGVLSTLLGTLIGFLTGVYVPLGILPQAVQRFVLFVPFSYSAAMLRQVFCEAPLGVVFHGAPAQASAAYVRMYGIRLFWGNTEVTVPVMLFILAAVTVVFLLLSAVKLRTYRKG